MANYGHAELISVSHNFEPLTLPSAQGRQGHTHRIALRFPLSHARGRGKKGSIEDMPQNNFSNKVYSLFTTHHSLIHTDTVFSRFTFH